MSALSIDVYVSRASGGPLNLNDGTNYRIVSINPGARAVENTIETSPFSNGGMLVHTRQPVLNAELVVRCCGTSAADALSKFDDLVEAMQAWAYTVTIALGSRTEVIECMPANLEPAWDRDWMRLGWVDVKVTVPRQP